MLRLLGHGIQRIIAVLVVASLVIVWQFGATVRERALREIEGAGYQRLDLYASSVSNALEQYSYLPFILSRDKDVRALLAVPQDPARVEMVNHNLEATNEAARAAALYVMDATGLTLAASNWRDQGSFVGNRYGFRPYFLQAVQTGRGRYFGVGVTTHLPGHFIANAVKDGDTVVGVAVVKADLEPLQRDWARGGEMVLVTDANQVAILSSYPEWKYGMLAAPTEEVRRRIASTQQYADVALYRLDFRPVGTLAAGGVVIESKGRRYLMQSRRLSEEGWVIHHLTDLEPVERRTRESSIMAAAGCLAASLLVLSLRQRRLRRRAETTARLAVAEALRQSRDELERKVEARTADLRDAQEELVQAGKMAALGQMSAAIAHELNQPLTAIQTYIASTRIFAERGDTVTLMENLGEIEGLASRMAEITGHLKAFARKTPGKREPVSIDRSIDRSLMLLESTLRLEDVEVCRGLAPSAWILGDEVRFEQVLVNLMRNAVDAMRGSPIRRLSIAVSEVEANWAVSIRDTGSGIDAANLDKLFDPFFSTKDVGQGLGLGLSLSYGIIRDFGGTIRVESNADGGAAFIVQVPALPSPDKEAMRG